MNEPTTPIDLPTLDRLHAEASAGPWRAGRSDMTSYDGNTGEAFKNVYGPEYEKHPRTGADIPLTVARGESKRCHANAAWIATIHNAFPSLSARLKELEADLSRVLKDGNAHTDRDESRIRLLEETLRGILQEKQTELTNYRVPTSADLLKQIAWLEQVLRGDK